MLTRPIKAQRRRKLTPEQELAVVDAYNAGDSGITIAARFGVSPPTIYKILHRYDNPKNPDLFYPAV